MPAAVGPEITDEELGIGQEDDAPSQDDAVAALLADPRFSGLIEAAVAQRLGALSGQAPAPSGLDPNAFDALAKTLGRMIEVNAMQQPGYIKPLPAGEVERRLDGKDQMEALLQNLQAQDTAPHYIVGEGGFFECTNAQEFSRGDEIRTYLPPPEDFVAVNVEAKQVMAAQMQWLGGRTPSIGEQVEAAMQARNGPPLVMGSLQPEPKPSRVELVKRTDGNTTSGGKRRTMGTVVTEPREVSMADRAGGAARGPVFVGAEA